MALLWDLRRTNWLQAVFFGPLSNPPGAARKIMSALAAIGFNAYRLMVALGTLAAIPAWRRRRELALFYAIPATMILFHFLLFIGASRYLVPAVPSLCLFLAALSERMGERRRPA